VLSSAVLPVPDKYVYHWCPDFSLQLALNSVWSGSTTQIFTAHHHTAYAMNRVSGLGTRLQRGSATYQGGMAWRVTLCTRAEWPRRRDAVVESKVISRLLRNRIPTFGPEDLRESSLSARPLKPAVRDLT